jgi:hypothetical protein
MPAIFLASEKNYGIALEIYFERNCCNTACAQSLISVSRLVLSVSL